MGKILKRAAITNDNLLKYLTDKYDVNSVQSCIKVNQLEGMTPLLQDDYGKDYDCTLTAITQILLYYLKGKTPEEIYNVVAACAEKLGFVEGWGTNPLVMRTLMNQAAKKLGLKKAATVKYGKITGYSFCRIKALIDAGRPIMLSMYKDGRDFYDDHSITVIGYGEYKVDNKHTAHMLKVYDNWYKEMCYVDYDLIHLFSSIHYYL